MSESHKALNSAVSDIEYIRQILEHKPPRRAFKTEAMMTLLLLGAATTFLAVELASHGSITTDFLASASSSELRETGIVNLTLAIGLLLLGIYALAWLKAREMASTLSRTLNRSFPFLRAEPFLADLLLKFAVLSLIIIVRRPDVVSALLVSFTADYVAQGRFFRLPVALRWTLGLGLYGFSALMVINGWVSVCFALGTFIGVAAISLGAITISMQAGEPS